MVNKVQELNEKIYLEISLIVNKKVYEEELITYEVYNKVQNSILEKLNNK